MENLIILPQRKISFFVQLTGLVFFGTLFYLSWRFYLERMLSSGGSFNVFQFMQSDSIMIPDERYGDYLSLLLPFLAFKMHATLSTILTLYSISFVLLHYLIFLFITRILKNNGAGIALMLACCVTYYYAFYMPTMELHEDMVLGVLLWAIIHPEYPYTLKQQYLATCGAILTIILMSFFHPMGIFLVGFVIGMEMLGAKRYADTQLWLITGIGICWYLVRFYVLIEQPNDQEFFRTFDQVTASFRGLRSWPSTKYFDNLTYLHFRSIKWVAIILLLASLRKGILAFLFFALYFLFVTGIFFSNFKTGAPPAVFENYYAVYGFFIGLIFVFIFYHPRRRNLVLLFSLPLLWGGVIRMYHAHDLFTSKISYLDKIVNEAHKKGETKCIIDSKCYPYDIAWDSWNTAFETLTYSSLKNKDSSVTVFIQNPEFARLCDSVQHQPNLFLGVHFLPLWYSSAQMPEGYFKLPSTGYSYLTHTQEDTAFHENIFNKNNVEITPLVLSATSRSNNLIVVIPLEINNVTGKIIPSIPRKQNPVYLSYNLYDDKDKLLKEGIKEPLETDVGTKSIEGMIVYCPQSKGVYYVRPQLITEGLRSWNIPSQSIKISVE